MSKKKELSPDFRAECDAAKALFISRKNGLGLTQAKLAEAAEISPAGVAMYLNGTNPLNAKFASVLSRMIGLPVEAFSSRLAKEIAQITQAAPPVINNKTSEKAGTYLAAKAMEMADLATPRSRAVLQRINQAATDGRLSEADINLLDQIAARFESRGASPAQHSEGSHKRLRDKLQNDDPHSKK
jgi:transcriptional regulator with XRE-family HTH domain